jgi:hypothetical protein
MVSKTVNLEVSRTREGFPNRASRYLEENNDIKTYYILNYNYLISIHKKIQIDLLPG